MIEQGEKGVRGGTKPRDNEEILLGMDGRQGRGEADSRSCKKSEITSYLTREMHRFEILWRCSTECEHTLLLALTTED